ncbi:MAG: tetratricopeptide repeat protein [Gemmatimonadota bacterium]
MGQVNGPSPRPPRDVLPSLLPRTLKRFLGVALALAAFMLANTLYLLFHRAAAAIGWRFFVPGELSLPKLLQAMVLTHTGVGLLLATLLIVFAVSHLPKVWRRRHRSSIVSGLLFVALGLSLAATGLFILTAAASRQNRWAWWAHVVVAALVPLLYLVHRRVSFARPPAARFRRFVAVTLALTLVLGAWHGLANREPRAAGVGDDAGGSHVTDPPRPEGTSGFLPAAFVSPGSPFFPSAATTSSGRHAPSRVLTGGDVPRPEELRRELERYGRLQVATVGAESCARCHLDVVRQWESSAHRFASFNNPFYEATVNDLRERSNEPNAWLAAHLEQYPEESGAVGHVKSKWCAACHDPVLLLPGRMPFEVERETPEAQAGLTCLACHAIDRIHDRTGNGTYNIADDRTDPYIFADAGTGTLRSFLHDAAIKARPAVHKRLMLRPFFRDPEFCSACHKVSLAVPVNNYRWLRGQDEFDNWDDSGISRNAARTFYLPPRRRVCQDCHMPAEPAPLGDVAAKSGLVRSHRFLAVNTALPFLRGDSEMIERIEEFLRDDKLRVDIFALTGGSRRDPVMALDRTRPLLRAGRRVTVDVVVRNRGVGHTFPGGTNDSNEGWLEFSLWDQDGRVLAMSGYVGPDGHLDPLAHRYGAVLLDRHGELIDRRNAQDIRAAVFANVIRPGTADLAHYEFTVPPRLAGRRITLRARLLWRKFTRRYTEFAFHANREGFRGFTAVPDLPISEIAADEVTLEVAGAGGRAATATDAGGHGTLAAAPEMWNEKKRVRMDHVSESAQPEDSSEWVRYNDYGIGLLMEGNTRGAALAFERVAELRPDRIDGPLNLARVAIRDGNLPRAYEYLRRSETIRPGDARAAWVWGIARQEDGRYGEAAAAYRRVLEEFPNDRATWRNLGRTYYLNEEYGRALEAFGRVLEIDPEDRIAHYHRMLSLRALGREGEAAAAEAAYEYYRVDESAKEITRAYRLRNPGANLMSQAIRTHELTIGKVR